MLYFKSIYKIEDVYPIEAHQSNYTNSTLLTLLFNPRPP